MMEATELLRRWLSVAGSKWSLAILDHLAGEPERYSRLLADLAPIAPKVLTQTLRRLEREGLVTTEQVGPAGRRYLLTPVGRELHGALRPLRRLAAAESGGAR